MTSRATPLRPSAIALVVFLLAGSGAEAGVVVLRDGRTVRIAGDYDVKGGLVLCHLDDGTYVSLRLRDVDLDRTSRANQLLGPRASRGKGPVEIEPAPPLPPAVARPAVPKPAPPPQASAPVGPPAPPPAQAPPPPPAVTDEPRPFDSLGEDIDFLALLNTRTAAGADVGPGGRGSRDQPRAGRPGPAEGLDVAAAFVPLPPPAPPLVAPLVAPPVAPQRPVVVQAVAPPSAIALGAFLLASPRNGEVVYGPTTLSLDVADEARDGIARVEFRVDGRQVATVSRAPFRALWNAPGEEGRRRVEATVIARDGRRDVLSADVRTLRPDLAMDVNLVSLPVTVTDAQRQLVDDLGAPDFVVLEDGVPQALTHFKREAVPLAVALVIDLSFSMQGERGALGIQAARGFVQKLEPMDRAALYSFDETSRSVVPFTADTHAVEAGLATLSQGGGTALFDTLMTTLEDLRFESGKRVVVLVSDGEDYLSKASLEDVLVKATEVDALIYGIGVSGYRISAGAPRHWLEQRLGSGAPKYWTDKLRLRGLKFMRRLSEASGGVLYLPKYTGELPYVFDHVHNELKNQYDLGYYSSNPAHDGGYRRVTLYVNRRGLETRTREGYFAPADGGALAAGRRAPRLAKR